MQSVRVMLIFFRVGIELMTLDGVGPWGLHCNILYHMAKRTFLSNDIINSLLEVEVHSLHSLLL